MPHFDVFFFSCVYANYMKKPEIFVQSVFINNNMNINKLFLINKTYHFTHEVDLWEHQHILFLLIQIIFSVSL